MYWWHGLEFDECGNSWVGVVGRVQLEIGMEPGFLHRPRGRVRSIAFGDPDVVLHCF